MTRALRWLRNTLIGLVVLLIVAAASAYVVSERALRRTYTEPATNIVVPTDAASVSAGMHLAKIHGCADCHGEQLAGRKFVDHLLIGTVASPDLTIAARDYSNADLTRIIRRGVRPDGHSVIGMPSAMFGPLRDDHLGKISATFEACRHPTASGAR